LLVAVVFANGRAVVACVLAIKCQKKCFGGSLASTLANILGISEYTGYFRILGSQLLVAVVFANRRLDVASVLANTKSKFFGVR